jgi:hypothetical protein
MEPLVVRLDKSIYNSYHQALRGRNTIALQEDETVIYDQGRQKVSTRSADVDYLDVKFRISLIDTDQDGQFNTPGVDLVIVSVYGQDTVALDLREAHVGSLRQRTFVQVNRRFFLIDALDLAGGELTLIPWERPPSEALAASTKTHLAKFSVRNTAGEEEYLSWPKGDRPRLLLFWNYSEEGKELVRAADQLQERWKKRLEVITFNMNDQLRELKTFQSANELDLPVYLVTSKTCRTINCHAHIPYGMLIDENGQILQSELRPAAIRSLLEGTSALSSVD